MAKATKKVAEKVLGGPVKTAKEKIAEVNEGRKARGAKPIPSNLKEPKAKAAKFKIPKSLAEAADLYYQTRERRLNMEKDAKEVQEQEAALREHLIANLPKSQAGGIAGKVARVEIKKRNVPQLADERKFFAYAHRKGNEDLVKESMVVSAVQARWEAGKSVPGVDTFTIVSLSVSKLK